MNTNSNNNLIKKKKVILTIGMVLFTLIAAALALVSVICPEFKVSCYIAIAITAVLLFLFLFLVTIYKAK